MGDKIYPFSNGSQYADWLQRNCDKCALYSEEKPECDIDIAFLHAQVNGGSIPEEIAKRCGYTEAHKDFHADPRNNAPPYTWDCPERTAEKPPPPPFQDELTLPMFGEKP